MMQTENFLPHMRDVIRCEKALHELNLMWRMIESSAKMNCPEEAMAILPTMAATREGFNRLEQELVNSLVSEKVLTVLNELGTKAQYVINIVVRNLYERTADVGYLATDNELCAFVAGQTDDERAARFRLRSYRNKYTVYDEILLLDVAGNVLVQIDETTPLEGSADPLVAQTLASDSFVETFRYSDLRPAKKQALIYSKRMLHPSTGAVVGILCLCFNFEQEMAGIFQSHRDSAGRSNMLLLDGKNRVLESADPLWMPVGSIVPVNPGGAPQLQMFAGREYLVRTFCAEGYQGYKGPPGWQGQVMIPVDTAFSGGSSNTLDLLDAGTKEGLLSHAQSFSAPLYEIMSAAETIRCVVWNGQVMTAGRRGELLKLKTILDQISETGARSNALFAKSINDLYETVLTSSLKNSEFVSHLLVDLLDRNLYERSDDCRWWAMTPELRVALANPNRDAATVAQLNDLLVYINSLYTVYTRLFVYDSAGRIVACSHPDAGESTVLGTQVDPATLYRVKAMRSEQDYCVTPFAPSVLYGGRPTYVYHAAVRNPSNPAQVVGGIGIVFDAEPEFRAMLQSALATQPSMGALFLDRQGRVISSSDPTRPVGSVLPIDRTLTELPAGESLSRIVVHDGQYAVMGCTASCGYREFKVTDSYKEDVLAIVFDTLGAVRDTRGAGKKLETVLWPQPVGRAGLEYATFFIDGALFAVPAQHVLEAVSASKIRAVSAGERGGRIGLLGLQREGAEAGIVWVFDLQYHLRGVPARMGRGSQVIIVRHEDKEIGLLVDELHGVPEFDPGQVMSMPYGQDGERGLVKHFIKANDGLVLIQAIDVRALFSSLVTRDTALAVEA